MDAARGRIGRWMQPQHRCRRREEEGGIKSESFAACDKQKPSKIRRRRRQISPPAAMAAQRDDEAGWSAEAARRVWGGAVPLQVHLHDADVTTLPPPPPFLVKPPAFPSSSAPSRPVAMLFTSIRGLPSKSWIFATGCCWIPSTQILWITGCLFGLQSF